MDAVTTDPASPGTGNPPADINPQTRMAAALRRDITYGHLPPGALIPKDDYAQQYHAGFPAARKALSALISEGLIWGTIYYPYAAPAGPPDPAASARLGAVLAELRQTAGQWLWLKAFLPS